MLAGDGFVAAEPVAGRFVPIPLNSMGWPCAAWFNDGDAVPALLDPDCRLGRCEADMAP